jgi:hypothetical protein
MMLEVVPGFRSGHPGQGVPQPDALVEGGELPGLDLSAQGGLSKEKSGERGDRVHLAVGQQPQLLQLRRWEQVGLVDGDDDRPALLLFLGGEQTGRLGDQGRGVEAGALAQAGDDGLVQATGPDRGVGQVDHGVPGRVQAGQRRAQDGVKSSV